MRITTGGVLKVRRVSRLLLLLSIGLGVAAPGQAAERLAMPYECSLVGDDVRLVPALETFYPIVGEREEQAVTACNPTASEGCRTIMVHRFAINCAGDSVDWMDVAAAVQNIGDKLTWIEGGHLNVVLPSRAPLPARSDCFTQTAGVASGLERRVVLKQDCLPWSGRSQIDHVILPAGYAPIGELGARLVLDGPETSNLQLAKADPDAVWEPSIEIEPYQERVESAAAGNDWVTVVEAEHETVLPSHQSEGNGLPWGWPWLLSAMLVATAALFVRMRQSRAPSLTDPSQAGQVVASLLERTEGVVKELKGASALREVLQSELDRVQRTLANVEAANRDPAGTNAERETKAATLYRALVRDLERIRRIADSAAASFSDARRSAELPRTKSEAYDVLGVNADVSASVLKKIADALRMSWHPDHARDEDDRREREERIRQINAAWELIADKRAAV